MKFYAPGVKCIAPWSAKRIDLPNLSEFRRWKETRSSQLSWRRLIQNNELGMPADGDNLKRAVVWMVVERSITAPFRGDAALILMADAMCRRPHLNYSDAFSY